MLFYPISGRPLAINVPDEFVLLNNVVLPNVAQLSPWGVRDAVGVRRYGIRLWVITGSRGPLGAVWAASVDDALDEAAAASLLRPTITAAQSRAAGIPRDDDTDWQWGGSNYNLSDILIEAISLTPGQVEFFRWAAAEPENTIYDVGFVPGNEPPNGWSFDTDGGWQYFPVGVSVRLRREIDRSPDFVAPVGTTGVVVQHDELVLGVAADQHIYGAERSGNVLWFETAEITDEYLEEITEGERVASLPEVAERPSLTQTVAAASRSRSAADRTFDVVLDEIDERIGPSPSRKEKSSKTRHQRALIEEEEWRAAGGGEGLPVAPPPPVSRRFKRIFENPAGGWDQWAEEALEQAQAVNEIFKGHGRPDPAVFFEDPNDPGRVVWAQVDDDDQAWRLVSGADSQSFRALAIDKWIWVFMPGRLDTALEYCPSSGTAQVVVVGPAKKKKKKRLKLGRPRR